LAIRRVDTSFLVSRALLGRTGRRIRRKRLTLVFARNDGK
jgi:hypothetical protein